MVKMTEQLADRQHPERNLRPLEELDMMDSFLFEAATEDAEKAEKIARIIIERVTGHRVKNLIIESQKSLKGINVDKRGIRMDLYSMEKDMSKENCLLRSYDIEPNNYYEKDLPRRNRYYQSLMDTKLLPSGAGYEKLPDVTTIWILPYDPFGDDRMLYTVRNVVAENEKLVYNDGVRKIFLYTKGTKGGSPKLKNLLNYMENTRKENAVDEELQQIQNIVDEVKCSDEERARYMKVYGVIDYEKRDSYEAGHEAGHAEKLIELVCRKITKGKEVAQIAEELEEDEITIKKIYDIAITFAPDFDMAKIHNIYDTILHQK